MEVIVLNADDSFLHYIKVFRAWQLIKNNKAMPYHPDIKHFIMQSFDTIIKIPAVIRLLDYVRKKYKGHVDCQRRNVFIRDNFTCCYCLKKLKNHECTLDHVIPKDQKGQSTWENLVTSCEECNSKKRNRTPRQAGMVMHFPAYQPTIMEFSRKQIASLNINNLISSLLNF